MTLQQFRILAAISKSGNLTKAALELSTSQPAISHQMKLLQLSYGARLYTRTPVGIALTDAGERLLAGIRPILESVAKLKNGSARVMERKLDSEFLRVGGSLSASAELLPSQLARFRQIHPNIELVLRTRTSEELERMVLDSMLDIAVSARVPRSDELSYKFLALEKVAMFVPANHHLAKKNRLSLADTLAEPLIIRGGNGSSGVVDKALTQIRESGVPVNIALQCDGPTAIKAAVRQNMGVGMVFVDSLKAEVAAGEFKILNVRGFELAGQSYIIYAKDRPLSSWAQEFIKLLRAAHVKTSRMNNSFSSTHSPTFALSALMSLVQGFQPCLFS